MAESVHFRALLAGFGAGAGRFLCVRTINGRTTGSAVEAIDCRFCDRVHNFGITRAWDSQRRCDVEMIEDERNKGERFVSLGPANAAG